MPIHDLGYRSLAESSRKLSSRWYVIAEQGSRLAWKNSWVRRLVYVLVVPTLAYGFGFWFFENWASAGPGDYPQSVPRPMKEMLDMPAEIEASLLRDPSTARSWVWSKFLLNFMQNTQLLHLTLMIGVVAPPLISQDFLRKTFVLYFSRPIRKIDYLFGKLGVIWGFGLLLSATPCLALFALAVALSPSLEVLKDTWDLPIKVVIAAVTMLLPMSLVALLFSAYTTSSRFATFAWFTLWIVGGASYFIVNTIRTIQHSRTPIDPTKPAPEFDEGAYYLLSPYQTIGRVQDWIFGSTPLEKALPALIATGLITVITAGVLYRRLDSPMRA